MHRALASILFLVATGTAAVRYAVHLAGSDVDRAFGTALDSEGNAWVVGMTASRDFPVSNALQSAYGGGPSDAFVAKLDKAGNILWCTYLGGSGQDEAMRVQVDREGNGYIIGFTRSPNFPTTAGAFQRTLKGNSDAFLLKLSKNGDRILYSTLLGGNRRRDGFGHASRSGRIRRARGRH